MQAIVDFFGSYGFLIYLVAQNAVLALSVYIMLLAGQLSLACIGFMAIGAYSSALLSMNAGVPYPFSLVLAAMISAGIAFLIGGPILRLKGVYLAITTVGFGELVRFTVLNWDYAGGAMGLSAIPAATETWHVFAFLVLLLYGFHQLRHSRYGRALVAIGRDEMAARTMGIPTTRYKIAAFVAGAVMASVAGSFSAHHTNYLSPSEFSFFAAVLVLIYAVFGGLGSYWGPVLGAIVLTLLPEVFRFLQDWRMIIYGVSVLVVVVFVPDGLLEVRKLFRRRKDRVAHADPAMEGPKA
ncbi:branched-chain amino acid ABC transporter permease [Rhodoferax sediminis]|uniref:branched-chain amino acid ABC transporter permease n=1 Tax=Rhodoferax sediminis TaxID=2509614 RepID=UPI001FCEBDF7|nr:branched-chain amino acid ABC transporter permease [Rhodoferax sediminis]